ncbi:hypothetical protein HYDPIDRAFT_24194 [Hydnomerulius pinastri MD-312]|nr:hypothetical protein HYDPIDRAFT_24194 [Hydnomerulius pinastri MD-312]
MSSSEGSEVFGSPRSQFSLADISASYASAPFSDDSSDDEIVWARSDSISDGSNSEGDFILLGHPLLDARSLPSTFAGSTGHPDSEGDLSSAFDKLSFDDHSHAADTSSSSGESDVDLAELKRTNSSIKRKMQRLTRKARRAASQSDTTSSSSDYRSGASTPTASYDEAAAFISRYLEAPVKETDTQLALLRALIIELGVRSPTASDLPSTLTSARKMLKSEVHINVKEYVATRDKGQSALRQILQPSKSALRKSIAKKGNRAPLKWVKKQGLQVLLVTRFV